MLKNWSARCRNPLCPNPSVFAYKDLTACAVACLRCRTCGTRYRLLITHDRPPIFKEDDDASTLLVAFERLRQEQSGNESQRF